MEFRKDLNGLRAIAVISVVLFHFNATWMPGGFAGVDVFFVISGFLMTGIIFKGIEKKNFSILQFYIARANRIIPALAVLCLILLVFGWFYITPQDYKVLGKHVGSSIGFLSNIMYWRESGYFDASSHEKWLLHTWSLSVEWQFYIIYPIALVLMRKLISLRVMKKVILLGTIFGFIICILITYKLPSASYYLFPTRAWEMMIGGLAYLYPMNIQQKNKRFLEWAGVSLIISSYFFISEENPWPGYLALLPVLGTFFVIQAHRNDSLITNNIIFQKLGSWSYSIYLWHWPLVVAIYYFSLSNILIYPAILLSILLGFFSYKYVEKIKFRNDFNSLFSYLKFIPLYIVILLGFISVIVFKYMPNSYLYQMPESVINSMERGDYKCFDLPNQHSDNKRPCKITEGDKKIFVTGDSHAYSSLPVFESIANARDLALTYGGYSGCPPLIEVYSIRPDQREKNCYLLNKKTVRYIIDNHYDYAFLIARWTYYTEGDYSGRNIQYIASNKDEDINSINSINSFKKGIKATFAEYATSNVKVIIMLQIPMQKLRPIYVYYDSFLDGTLSEELLDKKSILQTQHYEFQKRTNNIIKGEAKKYNNIFVIDPTAYMCNDFNCPIGNKISSYYFDNDHISVVGSFQLVDLINNSL